MEFLINHPRLLCLACLVAMWLMAAAGVFLRRKFRDPTGGDKDSYGYVVTATLTLLGLIISFTFSMAATRYDQRRMFEEAEANAIGTELVRAQLLPPGDAVKVDKLLRQYLDRRIDFYQLDYGAAFNRLSIETAQLQNDLWTAILGPAHATPTPVTRTCSVRHERRAQQPGIYAIAWWNRIPNSAWALMLIIALFANLLVGFANEKGKVTNLMLLVLPLIASVSFFLVADIDSPRGGLIRIPPRDLMNLSQSLGQQYR